MKFNLSALALLVLSSTFSSSVNAQQGQKQQGIRGNLKIGKGKGSSSSSQRRVLQGDQPATYLIQVAEYEHDDDSGRRLNLFDNRPEQKDAVELSNGLIYTVKGSIPPGWNISGQGVILPASTIIDDATATITLPNSSGSGRHLEGDDADVPKVENTITKDQERNLAKLHRQLAVTGSRTVLVVRVVDNTRNSGEQSYGFSAAEAECEVFGTNPTNTCNDAYNLAKGFNDCSYGKLQLPKAATKASSTPATVSNIANGVVTVEVSTNCITNSCDGTLRNDVTSALNSAFGVTTPNQLANHVMYCLPPNSMSGIAYAYINSWNSVYSNQWCNYPSAQMHEIGHNLNLHHSNEGATEYADQSGMMGYSYSEDDRPVMCFNAAKNYQLGWYSDKTKEVTDSWTGNIYGISDYSQAGADTVIVRIPASVNNGLDDWYVSFNRQTGINSGTVEGGNQVLVHKRAKGIGFEYSYLMNKLSAGGTYNSAPLPIKVESITTTGTPGYATVTIGTPPPPPPSLSPTTSAQPSPAPTTPPPTTSAPTPAPTYPPTAPPTVNCGDFNDKSSCVSADGATCVWEGNPKKGQCKFSGSGPTPPPAPTPPTTPQPTEECVDAGKSCSDGSVNCCNGCSGGKPSNRVCL